MMDFFVVVVYLNVPDNQRHAGLVGRLLDGGGGVVLIAVVDHWTLQPGPVVEGRGVSLRVTLEGDGMAQRHPHQLMWNRQHRWNCNNF